MESSKVKVNKVIKYVVFGAVTAGVEFLSFLLINESFSLYVASVISFLIGLTSSFLLNKYVVFQKSEFRYKEVIQFFALGVFNSQVSSLMTVLLAGFMSDMFAKVVSIGFIVVWNYLIMNHVIFRAKKSS